MGFFETGHFSFGQYDFDKFYAEVATNIPQGTGPEVHVINNGTEPTPAGTPSLDQESDLDFEVAIPIIYPQGTILYQLGNTPPANSSKHYDVFDDFLDALAGPFCNDHDAAGKGRVCNEFKPPNVLSVSYAGAEKPYLARFYKVSYARYIVCSQTQNRRRRRKLTQSVCAAPMHRVDEIGSPGHLRLFWKRR